MKALTFLTLGLMAALPGVSRADGVPLRQLDDMAFSTMNDARELRWLLRGEFVDAPNFGLLLGDSQMLLMQLRSFEDSLFRELPAQVLFNQLNHVRASAAQLRFQLTTPCAGCVKPDVIFYGGERFVIEEPRPEIVLPTEVALEILTAVEGKLQAMEDVLLGRPLPGVDAGSVVPGVDDLPAAPLDGAAIPGGELPMDPSGPDLPSASDLLVPPGQI